MFYSVFDIVTILFSFMISENMVNGLWFVLVMHKLRAHEVMAYATPIISPATRLLNFLDMGWVEPSASPNDSKSSLRARW